MPPVVNLTSHTTATMLSSAMYSPIANQVYSVENVIEDMYPPLNSAIFRAVQHPLFLLQWVVLVLSRCQSLL
jgi:hypothetical protein